MQVQRLPKDPGPAGWNKLLPAPEPAQPLEHRTTADWLVIGAGFAGLTAARRLSERAPGDRVAVLEAARVAEGPAGRNSGFMIDLPHDLSSSDYGGKIDRDITQTTDNRLAIDYAQSMAHAFGLGPEAFNRCGKINAAATAKGSAHNHSYATHLTAMNEPHEALDAAQMQDITGTQYYQSGLYTPGAAMIQPALYVRGVAQGLQSNRVLLHENSAVTALTRQGSDWVATTAKGQITAPRVILAVNGHLNSFGHETGRLMHLFTYASMTRALSPEETRTIGGQPVWGVTPADPLGTTVRRLSGTGGDRIVVRNRFTFNPEMELSQQQLARAVAGHDRAFATRFPQLDGIEMEHRWGGRLCVSLNDVQVVRELEPGLYAACCQNGLGTAKGTLAGMMAADLATGHDSPTLRRLTDADRPTRLPPAALAKIGANLRLRFGEWRAGAEV